MILFSFCCMIYLAFILLFLMSRRCRGQPGKAPFLEREAAFVCRIFYRRRLLPSQVVERQINSLFPGKDRKEEVKNFYNKKFRLILIVLLTGNSFLLCSILSTFVGGVLQENRYFVRNGYGEGALDVQLEATFEEGYSVGDISITVLEQKYEEAALETMADEMLPSLDKIVLGSNQSLEEIRHPLNLVQNVEDYPFLLQWETSDYSILSSDGAIQSNSLPEEGVEVELIVSLLYEEYRRQHRIPIRVYGPLLSVEEQWRKRVGEVLNAENVRQIHNEKLNLPDQIDDKAVTWAEIKESDSEILLLLIPVVAFFLYFAADQDLMKKMQERERQMLLDYPGIIQKLTLYMGAGMTVKSSFRKIAVDYRERSKKNAGRYAYEEMLLTCYELDNGMNEARAYEQFGKRCKMQQYAKLGSLLSQNLRRGNTGLLVMLKEEAKNSFEQRKYTAKKLGEEAGTKLLFPMMLMLTVVMVLIMVPAYLSFSY